VASLLAYTDKSIDYVLNKARNNRFLKRQLGEEGFAQHIAKLQAQRNQTLLRRDKDGLWTYPGAGPRIAKQFGLTIENKVRYPECKLMPWNKIPFPMRDYQEQAVEKLMESKHAAVSIGTGLGKSRILLQLAKEHSLKTVIVCPSVSIANQLYQDFVSSFG